LSELTLDKPTLRWVPQFVRSIDRAFLGDLYGWELLPQVDPLRVTLHLRFHRVLKKKELPHLRKLLEKWADANNCVYRRSEWKKIDFKALIILKALGPISNVNPYLEDK